MFADRAGCDARFIITGGAAPRFFEKGAGSLAGRARMLSPGGFLLAEASVKNWERLWLRGGGDMHPLVENPADYWRLRAGYRRVIYFFNSVAHRNGEPPLRVASRAAQRMNFPLGAPLWRMMDCRVPMRISA